MAKEIVVNQYRKKIITWPLSMKLVFDLYSVAVGVNMLEPAMRLAFLGAHRDCRGRRRKQLSGYGDCHKAEGVENC